MLNPDLKVCQGKKKQVNKPICCCWLTRL